MNNLRDTISNIFMAPIGDMSFVRYLNYVNESGKISARSLLDLCMVMLTYIEEQEKRQKQNEVNFKEIQEILQKLVEDKERRDHPNGGGGSSWVGVGSQVEAEVKVNKDVEKGDLLTQDEVESVKDTKSTDGFPCLQCDRVAKSALGLLSHQKTHNPK